MYYHILVENYSIFLKELKLAFSSKRYKQRNFCDVEILQIALDLAVQIHK